MLPAFRPRRSPGAGADEWGSGCRARGDEPEAGRGRHLECPGAWGGPPEGRGRPAGARGPFRTRPGSARCRGCSGLPHGAPARCYPGGPDRTGGSRRATAGCVMCEDMGGQSPCVGGRSHRQRLGAAGIRGSEDRPPAYRGLVSANILGLPTKLAHDGAPVKVPRTYGSSWPAGTGALRRRAAGEADAPWRRIPPMSRHLDDAPTAQRTRRPAGRSFAEEPCVHPGVARGEGLRSDLSAGDRRPARRPARAPG